MSKIKILALMGKAGAGKDTILQEILKQRPDFYEIVSCTSRPKRENEINGVHYNFYTKEEFQRRIDNNEMLEYTEFNGWLYGTGKVSIDKRYINVGVFNPAGIRSLINNPEVDVKVIWVRASAKTRLLRQLNRESAPNVDEIIRRYQTDEEDFSNLNFPYKSVDNEENTSLKWVYANIQNLLGSWTILDNL